MHDRLATSNLIKAWGRAVGFDLIGIAGVSPSAHGPFLREYLTAGKHGSMHYLEKDVESRIDLTKKFPWAKSAVCVALAYFQPPFSPGTQAEAGVASPNELSRKTGKIARYAWGRDYHKVIAAKLRQLETNMRAELGSFDARAYVDTGPILERELAARAGLGWIGKNTLLIHPRHGSYFLLGEMLTSLDLAADDPIGNHCGTCTRCIQACPTAAITPYSVDARACISYQTLENRGPIPPELHAPMREAGWLIGCDICQEVCPFNRNPLELTAADFQPREPADSVPLQQILQWRDEDWDTLTRGRALRRAKRDMWQRNARVLARE